MNESPAAPENIRTAPLPAEVLLPERCVEKLSPTGLAMSKVAASCQKVLVQ